MIRSVSRLVAVVCVAAATLAGVAVSTTSAAQALPPVCEDECGGGSGGGGGGGTPVPPFAPPPPPNVPVDVPVSYDGVELGTEAFCYQEPHAFVNFSRDVVRGTPLYPTGIVPENSRANFWFLDEQGQVVKTHLTANAHDNCVIQHEPEAMSTADLAPGYYYVYANFWTVAYSSGQPRYWFGYPIEHGTTFLWAIRIR